MEYHAKTPFICPQCGAVMTLNSEHTEAHCEYCGATQLVEKPLSAEEKAYADKAGKLRAEREDSAVKAKQQRRRKLLTAVIVLSVCAVIAVATIVYANVTAVNPFDSIEVKFHGTNGQSEVSVRFRDGAPLGENDVYFTYNDEAAAHLRNGDTLKITANERIGAPRFSVSSKSYTVEGLTPLLMDLDKLEDSALSYLKENSLNLLAPNIDPDKSYTQNEPLLSCERVKLTLLADSDASNALYDVYKVTFRVSEGEETYYVIAKYEDIVLNGGSSPSLQCAGSDYCGQFNFVGNYSSVTGYLDLKTFDLELNNSKGSHTLTERVF